MKLVAINENNWIKVANLKVTEEQKQYVAPAVGILARAYAMRSDNAEALAIVNGEDYVGLVLIRDLNDEPSCYDLQQFFIDQAFQNKGFGQLALKLILEKLALEKKYPRVDICVKRSDESAIHVYKKAGFVDSGYVSPDAPDSLNLVYVL